MDKVSIIKKFQYYLNSTSQCNMNIMNMKRGMMKKYFKVHLPKATIPEIMEQY